LNAQGNIVDGNLIGTNATGTGPVPNSGPGVRLSVESTDNVIGGGVTAAGNTIAFNGGGIFDTAVAGSANAFGSNRIHSNAGLGIDLGNDGMTPNDSGDLDAGPNDLLNFPVLTSAGSHGHRHPGSRQRPGATFTIRSGASCDASGCGG
jgi:hypothetical protein